MNRSQRSRFALVAVVLAAGAVACRFGVDVDGLFGGGGTATPIADGSPTSAPDAPTSDALKPSDASTTDGSLVGCNVKPCAIGIAAGGLVSCAVFDDGKVRCWGENGAGAVGGNQRIKYVLPVEVPLSAPANTITTRQWGWPWQGSLSDQGVTCAGHAGGVSCWGTNKDGALGRGSLDASAPTQPATVVGLAGADEISIRGSTGVCARSKGSVSCWGTRLKRVMDAGATGTPEPLVLPGAAESIAGGRDFECAILATKDVVCGGSPDSWNPFWKTDGGNQPVDFTTTIDGMHGASQITLGNNHLCAIVAGNVICMGRNNDGQLGRGTTSYGTPQAPAEVKGLPVAARSIGAGANHTCAALVDDSLWCWGRNDAFSKSNLSGERGQLGVGGVTEASQPLRVGNAPTEPIVAIRGGYAHTCALTRGGSVYCWGSNDYGQLGVDVSANEPHPTPTRVKF